MKRTTKASGTMGRPTKLSADLQARIVRQLRAGGYVETAAAACGVAKPTLYAWLRQGNAEEAGPHRDFLNAVDEAIALAEQRDVSRIDRAASKDWRPAAWRLERRNPRRWGARVQLSIQEELEGFRDHLETTLDAATFQRVCVAAEAWDGSPRGRGDGQQP